MKAGLADTVLVTRASKTVFTLQWGMARGLADVVVRKQHHSKVAGFRVTSM